MNNKQKQELLSLARSAVSSQLGLEKLILPQDEAFQKKLGLFVTLHKKDQLRGCIGYIRVYKSIGESIVEMARAAAFRDPRFRPVTEAELKDITFEISLLSELMPVADPADIVVGRDGLYIENPLGSGLLLPQVATEWNWDRDTFLQQVCHKAGLYKDAYKDRESRLYRFTAEIFSEADVFD